MSDVADAFMQECADLDELVAPLAAPDWSAPTPAPGWTIAHQIGHLAWTDEVALLAVTDPEGGFARVVQDASANPLGFVDAEADRMATLDPGQLLQQWRNGRADLTAALNSASSEAKLPWFGPPMRARSMATARLMETWAHGQDVADALGVSRAPTARLKDICHLGVRTRDFAYLINGLQPPQEEFGVELTGPDGQEWIWGPTNAPDGVRGSAEDFCLLVTQRREPEQTALDLRGEAVRWAGFAQAFAGAPKSVMRDRK